jgi:membrane-bound ClpP family serine protease
MGLAVAVLILAGIVLLIVEVIFVPGTTVIGILGIVFVVSGILFSYYEYGSTVGNYVTGGASILALAALYVSFRKGAWKKFSLNTSISSKVNEEAHREFTVGMEGVTVSAMRPMGTAEFNGKLIEVKTSGDYLAPGTRVKIVYVQPNDILVEPCN